MKSDHFWVPENRFTVPGLDLKLVQKRWKVTILGSPKTDLLFLDLIWNWSKNGEKWPFLGPRKPIYCSWTWFETGPKTVKSDHFGVPENRFTVPGLDLKLVQKQWIFRISDHFVQNTTGPQRGHPLAAPWQFDKSVSTTDNRQQHTWISAGSNTQRRAKSDGKVMLIEKSPFLKIRKAYNFVLI